MQMLILEHFLKIQILFSATEGTAKLSAMIS